MSRVITITSGKGGVGKTNVSVNVAIYLASHGYRTCLFDADMGLANIDILMGIYPEYTLEDVFTNNKDIKDIIIRNQSGIDIIPGGSGVKKLADPDPDDINYLIKSLSELDEYDFFIFDTSAGISQSVVSFCMASPEVILVITPEPTSLTDAYSLLKVLCMNCFGGTVMLVINRCMSMEVANKLYSKFKEVVYKYLKMEVLPLGTIPLDARVAKAVKEQQPLISLFPDSDAAKGIRNISRHLISKGLTDINEYNMTDFWQKCLEIFQSPLKLSKQNSPKSTGTITIKQSNEKDMNKELPGEEKEAKRDTAKNPFPKEIRSVISEEIHQMDSRDIYNILNNLVKGISSISSELSAIRKIIEKEGDVCVG